MIYPVILDHQNSREYTKNIELGILDREYTIIDSSYLETKFSESFNIGIIKGFNKIKSNDYSHIMICNNDITLNSDILLKLEEYIQDYSGIFSPTVNSPHAGVMSKKGDLDLREVPWLEFICPIFSSDIINDVGFLDMNLSYGWGVELDYCYRAANIGYKTFLVQNVRIQHYEHRSQENHSEYAHIANLEMNYVLASKYGEGWQEKLNFPQW